MTDKNKPRDEAVEKELEGVPEELLEKRGRRGRHSSTAR